MSNTPIVNDMIPSGVPSKTTTVSRLTWGSARAATSPLSQHIGQIARARQTSSTGLNAKRPGWPGRPAVNRSGGLPVAVGAEFDAPHVQVLAPEIAQWRELVLAARIV